MKRKRNLEENEENRKVFHDKIMSMCYNEKRRLKFHEDENGGNHENTECCKYSEVFRA